MAYGGLSKRKMDALMSMIADPTVDPALQGQLSRVAHFLSFDPQRQQEEQDRRWRKLAAYVEALPEEQKPATMGGHRDVLAKFGFQLVAPMPEEDESVAGPFGEFMERFGVRGLKMKDSYEMKGTASDGEAKTRCDHCKAEGATKRCKECGEWYCSRQCQVAAWRSHKQICKAVAAQRF